MKKIVIQGGKPLEGEVFIAGAKNSALPIICASLLCRDQVKLTNIPHIEDIEQMLGIIRDLNVDYKWNGDILHINGQHLRHVPIMSKNVSKLRASYYLMGVYLALFGQVMIGMPGGCDIGSRPIDLHLKAFNYLNCECHVNRDGVEIKSNQLKPAKIFLDLPSVGVTINIMLATVLLNGTTIIENAAKEPEIVDVANFLKAMGAKITGAGSSTIVIEGVKELRGCEYRIIPDRIEAGTYALMAAANCSEVDIVNFECSHHNALLTKMIECKIKFKILENRLKILKSENLAPIQLATHYFPGFPTDLQQIFVALLTKAKGVSSVQDQIYPKRFANCHELMKMGARIILNQNTATIYGPRKLKGAEVKATDLRGGASLILAGLMADGVTLIQDAEHIYRGYSGIVEKLTQLNVKIHLIER